MSRKRSKKHIRRRAAKDRYFRGAERKRAAPPAHLPPTRGITDLPLLVNGNGPIRKRGRRAGGSE